MRMNRIQNHQLSILVVFLLILFYKLIETIKVDILIKKSEYSIK